MAGSMQLHAKYSPSSGHDTRGRRSSHGWAEPDSCKSVSWADCFPADPWNWVDFFPHPTVTGSAARGKRSKFSYTQDNTFSKKNSCPRKRAEASTNVCMYQRHKLTLSKLSGTHGDLGDRYQFRATVPRWVQCVRHEEEGARSGTEYRQLLVRTPRHSQESIFDTTYTLHLCGVTLCASAGHFQERERDY